jgi:hypothetical protein
VELSSAPVAESTVTGIAAPLMPLIDAATWQWGKMSQLGRAGSFLGAAMDVGFHRVVWVVHCYRSERDTRSVNADRFHVSRLLGIVGPAPGASRE